MSLPNIYWKNLRTHSFPKELDGLHDSFDVLLYTPRTWWVGHNCIVLRSYLANPLENPLASLVDNCVRAVWMKQLKLTTRGQRNTARNSCSDKFYWLYLNPASSDTLHQYPASSPGHACISENCFIRALQLPSPHASSTSCHTSLISPLQNYFAEPKVASVKWHVGKRFSPFWTRLYCWVAMGTWLPSTPSLYKCAPHCSSPWAMSYDLRGSTEGEKPQQKALYRKYVILILTQTSLLYFFSYSQILLYFIFSVLVLKFLYSMRKKSIVSFCRLKCGLEMSMPEIMIGSLSTSNALPACPALPGPSDDVHHFHCTV